MRKLVLLLACVLLTGCGATKVEQNTDGFTRSESRYSSLVAEELGTGSFDVRYSKGMVRTASVNYKVYKDTESGYCFVKLQSNNYSSLLIPLVNVDDSFKEYSDSNTNEITLVGMSQDETVFVIEDEDTGVQYVCNGGMSSYFRRY